MGNSIYRITSPVTTMYYKPGNYKSFNSTSWKPRNINIDILGSGKVLYGRLIIGSTATQWSEVNLMSFMELVMKNRSQTYWAKSPAKRTEVSLGCHSTVCTLSVCLSDSSCLPCVISQMATVESAEALAMAVGARACQLKSSTASVWPHDADVCRINKTLDYQLRWIHSHKIILYICKVRPVGSYSWMT